MEIIEVSPKYFGEIIPKPYQVFGSAEFNDLNRDKCDALYFLLFKDSKYRLGIVTGVRNGDLHTPFSAPFGGFSPIRNDLSLQQLETAVGAFIQWAGDSGYRQIYYTMPPLFYNPLFLNKVLSVLPRRGFEHRYTDLNYQFELSRLTDSYEEGLWPNARNKLRIARKNPFLFFRCETKEQQASAFETIMENRSRKGFPLRMTWEQVQKTVELINADFFQLTLHNNPVAAALVFKVSPQIAQVIYWGDIPDFAAYKPMNYLSYQVFLYYRDAGMQVVDIGPSTEAGVPNYGLCEFKESIGCSLSPKFSFVRSL